MIKLRPTNDIANKSISGLQLASLASKLVTGDRNVRRVLLLAIS